MHVTLNYKYNLYIEIIYTNYFASKWSVGVAVLGNRGSFIDKVRLLPYFSLAKT